MNLDLNDSENRTSYDEVPYVSQPFTQTHPDRLATLGRLFGLAPTPLTRCRVLELGCASGGNLLPMAFHLPGSEFVGVDLSRRQVEMGRKAIQDLDLTNIHIAHASIQDVDTSWGMFDYIISHGVYSWVPGHVQDKILAIAAQNLADQGIAYVSYNTYPGWHMRDMVRHMMLYHANQFNDRTERIEQARALIDFLAHAVPTENNAYGLLLQSELNFIRQTQDWYLFHDHLEDVNAPVYFHQFIERADRHGLQYLAEADFAVMLTSGFPNEIAETLQRISHNLLHAEQYMDFVRNRMFRQTLLCHKELPLKRHLAWQDTNGLQVAAAITPETEPVNVAPGVKQTFRTPRGVTIKTDFPLTKAAMAVLKDCWPRAMPLDALWREATARLSSFVDHQEPDEPQSRQMLAEDLLRCYASGGVEFHTWQADFVTQVSEWPQVSRLAVYLNGQGGPVVNQRHEVMHVDSVAKQLIRVLDGTRDRAALLRHLEALVAEGTLMIREHDKPVTNAERIRQVLSETIEQTLLKLARAALLVK